jgi:tetratricopeptide (TPR) repeat protein
MKRYLYLTLQLFLLFFIISCATKNVVPVATVQPSTVDADLSCSYFYFLWGAHAEFNQHYEEAQEAYEKALICDPSILYIREKLPILLLRMGKTDEAIAWLSEAIAREPEEINYRLLLASLHIQQKEYAQATELYELASKQKPEDHAIKLRLGLLYSQTEQFDKAERIFNELRSDDEESYAAYLALARLYRRNQQFDRAAESYERALDLNWSKDLAYELAQFYLGQHQYEKALRIVTTVTDNDPFDESGALSRVQVLLDLQRSAQALEELEHIREYSRNPTKIDVIIAKILIHDNRIAEATALLTKAAGNAEDSEPEYLLGLIAYQRGNMTSSLDHLGHVSKTSHQHDEAVYLQSQILQELDKTEAAISLLKRSISDKESRSPLFYVLLSAIYQKQNNYREAATLMIAGIDAYPDNPELIFEYGMVLERSGQHEKAVSQMEKVLSLQPEHAEALNYLGYTWADQNRNLDKALQYIKKANEIRPDNGFILDSLGWVYYRLGKFAKAAEELERAIELEPDDPHIYEHLGDTYSSLGNKAKALTNYRNAARLFHDVQRKKLVQDKIDALQHQ